MTPAATTPALVATYRLQLHAGFTFADAQAVVPYLADLGVSHLYLSPVLQAVPGSTHGYDQCDPTRISEDLDGAPGFRALVITAREHGLGILLDIVPNHMAADSANPWWWELLRSGRHGEAGGHFDIDWETPDADLHEKVMVPVLSAPLEEVLGRGELRVEAGQGGPVLAYFDQRFPLNGDPDGKPVADVLAGQAYLPAHWREALRRLNYRRFFDINSLVALRQEEPAVFAAAHALVFDLVDRGEVQGLRIDHVDGLRNPQAYLENIRRRAPGAWLLVEKILEPGERLPRDWRVAGTTGYDFIHRLGGVFVDPAGGPALTALYQEFTGDNAPYGEVVAEAKLQVARELFAPDIARLERLLAPLCAGAEVVATAAERAAAITAVAVAMPVYRTYMAADGHGTEADGSRVETAVAEARVGLGAGAGALLDVLRDALLVAGGTPAEVEFALRFQQLSGPLMAKGVEDTAFYRYHRLACLNEVGADPAAFGVSPAEFHAANQQTAAAYPQTMLASSTHDTKRSEDVRARLALLSQVPTEWAAAVGRWSALNARHHADETVDRNTEYLLYQTLVAAWPLSEERALQYMRKAVREAKRHTGWIDPDPGYEAACGRLRQRGDERRGLPRRAARLRRAPCRPGLPAVVGPVPAQADRARGSRHLPGHGGLGPQPGRPRQPAPGGLRPAPAAAVGPARRCPRAR